MYYLQCVLFIVISIGSSVQCTVLRSGNDPTERELIGNSCKSCGRFRSTMRKINADDSCVQSCRAIRTSDWECGTCDEWNQSYPGFDTTLDLQKVTSESLQNTFRDATAQWNKVITGDLPSVLLSSAAKSQSRFCTARSIPRVIDDIYICIGVQKIDGRGGVLGQAGAEIIRPDSKIPVLGGMMFDVDDVEFMVKQGIFDEVILHEIGHVYGISSVVWKARGLLDRTQKPCSYKLDSYASAEWQKLSGCTTSIPIENDGGAGTVCSHFDEMTLTNELMTGYVRNAVPILSRLTVGTLQDLGYTVNYDAAQEFNGVNGTCSSLQTESSTQELEVINDSGLENAIEYGMELLEQRAQFGVTADNNRRASSKVEYIGDQTISIVYMDDAGDVRHVALTNV